MFTFTSDELRQLLQHTCNELGKCDDVYDFSLGKASQLVIAAIMNGLLFEASQPQRDTLAENSLPAIDEDNEFEAIEPDADDSPYPEFTLEIDDLEWQDNIPHSGQPIPHETDDNISPAELGLQPVA